MKTFLSTLVLLFLFSFNSFSGEFNWGINISAIQNRPSIDISEKKAAPKIGGSGGLVFEYILGTSNVWSIESGAFIDFNNFLIYNHKKPSLGYTMRALSIPLCFKYFILFDEDKSLSFGGGARFSHYYETEVSEIKIKKNNIMPLIDFDFSLYDFRISATYEIGVTNLIDKDAYENKDYRNPSLKMSNIRLGVTWFFL